jgi:hypothetical protein
LRHRARPDRHATPERTGYVPEEPVALLWRERRCGGSQRREFLVVKTEQQQWLLPKVPFALEQKTQFPGPSSGPDEKFDRRFSLRRARALA